MITDIVRIILLIKADRGVSDILNDYINDDDDDTQLNNSVFGIV